MENLWEKISYVYNNYNAQLRDDIGGVQYTPSILILFYDDDGIARAKFEGTEEIRKGMVTGLLKEVIREFIRRRNRLKASERMAEALAIHVAGMMISAEQRRRSPSSFEERMRMLAEEKESEKQKKVIVMTLCLIDKCGLSYFCWHACVYNRALEWAKLHGFIPSQV